MKPAPTCGPMPPMPLGGFILIGPPMFGCPEVREEERSSLERGPANEAEGASAVGTLRSGGVQAVWQKRLRPRDAPRRLVWHTEGGSRPTWVPRRHERLREENHNNHRLVTLLRTI